MNSNFSRMANFSHLQPQSVLLHMSGSQSQPPFEAVVYEFALLWLGEISVWRCIEACQQMLQCMSIVLEQCIPAFASHPCSKVFVPAASTGGPDLGKTWRTMRRVLCELNWQRSALAHGFSSGA